MNKCSIVRKVIERNSNWLAGIICRLITKTFCGTLDRRSDPAQQHRIPPFSGACLAPGHRNTLHRGCRTIHSTLKRTIEWMLLDSVQIHLARFNRTNMWIAAVFPNVDLYAYAHGTLWSRSCNGLKTANRNYSQNIRGKKRKIRENEQKTFTNIRSWMRSALNRRL